MKSVLISIQPKWCELIAIGKKKVELRKSRPKIETPFKCYIYETKTKDYFAVFHEKTMGKVIGEFVCDCITSLKADNLIQTYYNNTQTTCLTDAEIMEYANGGKLYYWHISDLVIYEQPKELSEFYRWTDYDDSKNDKRPCSYCEYNDFDYSENCEYCSIDYDGEHCVHLQMKKPPQSWCYVDDVKGGAE